MARLKRRSDGRFQKRAIVGRVDGRNVYKTVYGATIKEVEQKADSVNSSLFRDWAEKWFAVYKADNAYNTQKQYRRMLDGYILPVLGDYRLTDINPADVRELVNDLAAKGIASTAGLVLLTIKQILDAAMENEMLSRNAAASLKPPKVVKAAKSALDKTERGLVMGAAEGRQFDKHDAFLFLLFFTGVRRGEALALTDGDIDLDGRVIHVNKTVIFCPNEAVVKPSPKTSSGVRDIPIAKTLADVLDGYLSINTGNSSGDKQGDSVTNEHNGVYTPLFFGKDGGFLSLSAFRAFWRRCLERFGLPGSVTPHKFRHNFATELFYADIDIKEAQRLMGHAGTSLMLDVYTHSRSLNGETALKLDGIK